MKRTISLRPYILVTVLVVVVFFGSNYFLTRTIEDNFFVSLEKEYINYASIYSHGLTKTAEAYQMIHDMLERRLSSTIDTIALYSDEMNNESLIALAASLAVDDIYLYDATGKIEYSSREDYLGWLATPGHPVHDFMISNLTSYTEGIRRDTESSEYYKYSYLKLEGGRFVQVGINATLVESFLSPFEIERLLEEIREYDLIDYVYFINPDHIVTTCCDLDINLQLENPEILAAIESMTTYSLLHSAGEQDSEVYEIFIPISVGDDFIGTLAVAKTTDEVQTIARTAAILAFLLSAIVFSSFIYIMLSNYRHNRQLSSLAYNDGLTGLPNDRHLHEMLNEISGRNVQGKLAIVMIQCHNFNMINSTYGLDVGERVIKELAIRLGPFVSDEKQLFRVDTNRFALLVQDYENQDELRLLAEQIIDDLARPLAVVGRALEIRIALVQIAPGQQAANVLSQASKVLHHLEQEQGGVPYAFFDAEIEERLQRAEVIAQEMSKFLAGTEFNIFHLEYQPKVSLASNQIVGFEALSRMTSPALGRVSPVEFISIAEQQEMIIPLGYWALETACQFLRKLNAKGYNELYVAVNISVIQLLQDEFAVKVKEIVTKAGINPRNLQLEITESVLIEDFDDIQAKLRPLRDLGLTIALDDFGTGYSALSRMGELAVDFIKIDKSFIDKILVESQQRQIIEEIIAMCHKLELMVVAEGVEHEKQRQYLRDVGCDIMQGYLYSKPLPEELALEKVEGV